MKEILLEIFHSMRKNKLRTFLTGFSVAWGIFMLVILLGSGNGLKNGTTSNFDDEAINSMSVYGGWTTRPYAGYELNRYIRLNKRDYNILQNEFPEIKQLASRSYMCSGNAVYKTQSISVDMTRVTPELKDIEGIKMLEGRYINQQDIEQCRKTVVVDERTRKVLFENASPIGKEISINGIIYTIVGVCKGNKWGNSSDYYIPMTTGEIILNRGRWESRNYHFLLDNIENEQEIKNLETRIRRRLAAEHSFDPEDENALGIWNNFDGYKNMMMVFNGITIFIWIIGLGTLSAGIVGVSNIMLVTVRERTSEFGIHKALGAPPSFIIFQILTESILITSLFGYIGMILGVGTMEIVNYIIESKAAAATEDSFIMFKNPTLQISIVFSATIVLIVSGLIAGYVPARRAARLKTIDALRFNK